MEIRSISSFILEKSASLNETMLGTNKRLERVALWTSVVALRILGVCCVSLETLISLAISIPTCPISLILHKLARENTMLSEATETFNKTILEAVTGVFSSLGKLTLSFTKQESTLLAQFEELLDDDAFDEDAVEIP